MNYLLTPLASLSPKAPLGVGSVEGGKEGRSFWEDPEAFCGVYTALPSTPAPLASLGMPGQASH